MIHAKIRIALRAMGILLILSATAGAATYYVDPTVASSGDGSAGSPWKTLADVASGSTTGDSVYIRHMDATISGPHTEWPSGRLYYADDIYRHGVTWTLDQDYRCGQFANGDIWIHTATTASVTAIDPAWNSGTGLNGSMLNPVGNTAWQGLANYAPTYSSSLNVGTAMPLSITPLSTLVSAVGRAYVSGTDPAMVATLAVLTVVSTVPDEGSFRPGVCTYSGRAVEYNISDLDYSGLGDLDSTGAPTLHTDTYTTWSTYDSTVERRFECLYMTFRSGASARYISPKYAQKDYPRDIGVDLGIGLLSLQLDYPDADKETLLVRLVQLGLDAASTVRSGGSWQAEGGFAGCYKAPMVLAASVLGDSELMAEIADDYRADSAVDVQTFYVTAGDCYSRPYTLSTAGGYYWTATGTVTLTQGSTTVTGSGTNWTTSLPIPRRSGYTAYYFGANQDASDPRSRVYKISTIDSDTQITLSRAYEGASGSGLTYKACDVLFWGHGYGTKLKEMASDYFDYPEYTDGTGGYGDWTGLPDWTTDAWNRDKAGPTWDNGNPTTATYRYSGAQAWPGCALAMHIMGLTADWAGETPTAFFDYVDRFVERSQSHGYAASWITGANWVLSMWNAHRDSYPPVWSAFADSPSPAHSATGVAPDASCSWTMTEGVAYAKVYFGTDSTPDETEYIGEMAGSSYNPGGLQPFTTYYWRINPIDGDTYLTGEVWSFTTGEGGEPPTPASGPSPANLATGVATTAVLSWTAGEGAATHNVYLGTVSGELASVSSGQAETTFTPAENFSYSTTYFWRIDEVPAGGGTPTTGTEWQFTTRAESIPPSGDGRYLMIRTTP